MSQVGWLLQLPESNIIVIVGCVVFRVSEPLHDMMNPNISVKFQLSVPFSKNYQVFTRRSTSTSTMACCHNPVFAHQGSSTEGFVGPWKCGYDWGFYGGMMACFCQKSHPCIVISLCFPSTHNFARRASYSTIIVIASLRWFNCLHTNFFIVSTAVSSSVTPRITKTAQRFTSTIP